MATDPIIDCPKCGQDHYRCKAHNKQGNPCRRKPARGAAVCPAHGGGAPQVRRAAKQRHAEDVARKALKSARHVIYGEARDISPIDALMEEVHWTAGHVAWLRQRVQDTEEADLVKGVTKIIDTHEGYEHHTETVPNVWLNLYDRERKHLVWVSKEAIRAGLDERMVKQAERLGDAVVDILDRVFADPELAMTQKQQSVIPDVVSRHLSLISGRSA